VFPPPKPWKQVATIDPDREYVAFTSRFFMKSPRRVLKFLSRTGPIERQVDAAPGVVGWSLGANLLKLEFYTLSAWEDAGSLQRFAHEATHGAVMREFAGDMRRKSLFVHYTVRGSELPLAWKEALRRQNGIAEESADQTSSAGNEVEL
jgi:hypothetical protein